MSDWLVDPDSNSISRGKEQLHVEPKAMRVLSVLAANAGKVVTREELEDTVWAGMVVGPDAVTNTIIKLRKSLGDDAKNPAIIETIPKAGYRLIAAFREAEEGEVELPLERRLSAILYADVAGYSKLTGEDEERTYRVLSNYLDLFAESIQLHNGNVVNYAGDAVLAEFSTVSDAINCAVSVQREFQEKGESGDETSQVQFRIGINLGEVIVARDDIYGEGVNIAARLEGLADAGGVCISESAKSAIGNKLPLEYEFMGEQTVKNIEEPVRAYRVLFYPGMQKRTTRLPAKKIAMAACLATLVVAAGIAWNYLSPKIGSKEMVTTLESDKPSIAVLPLANVNVDPADEYFADGVTDDIITDLSKVSGLRVIARSSVFTYKNQALDIRAISDALGARYIIEGSVRRADERVRINVQLVDAVDGHQLWAERYDDKYSEIFKLQEKVIGEVINAVSVTLTDTESAQISQPPTSNLQAYDYYLRAQQSGYIGATANVLETIQLYQKALELDSEFSDAHSGLARVAVEAWRVDISELISGAAAKDLAYRSASRALEIDPSNVQAYSVLAVLQLGDGHHDAAIKSARKAVELGPGVAQSHLDLGLVLAYSGDPKAGIDAIDTALSLNPRPTPETWLYSGIVYFIDRQYGRSVEMLSRAKEELPNAIAILEILTAALSLNGQIEDAVESRESLVRRYPASSIEYYRAREQYFRVPEDHETYLEGLRLSGLPQWPFDFQGVESDRLDREKLGEIIDNKTWVGSHSNGMPFIQEVNSSGTLAYRDTISIVTGKISINGDKLCQQFDGITLSRDLCGFVYNNPDGSIDTEDQYIYILPDTLRYFALKL